MILIFLFFCNTISGLLNIRASTYKPAQNCIEIFKRSIDQVLSKSLLFIHALSGCDTTSGSYCIGKISAMGKYVELKGASQIFMLPNKDHNEVEQAGNEALAIIYACKQGTDLNLERASKFSEKVESSSRCVLLSGFPQLQMPPNFTAEGSTTRCKFGKVTRWRPLNGAGRNSNASWECAQATEDGQCCCTCIASQINSL